MTLSTNIEGAEENKCRSFKCLTHSTLSYAEASCGGTRLLDRAATPPQLVSHISSSRRGGVGRREICRTEHHAVLASDDSKEAFLPRLDIVSTPSSAGNGASEGATSHPGSGSSGHRGSGACPGRSTGRQKIAVHTA